MEANRDLSTTPATIAGPPAAGNQALYQGMRFVRNTPTLSYQFPVTNGAYAVTLKFAEIYFGDATRRKFEVKINGAVRESGFTVGPALTAVDPPAYQTTVTNSKILIELTALVAANGETNSPIINAIQIVPQ